MKLRGKYLIGIDAGSGGTAGMFIVPVENGRLRLEKGRTVTREEFEDAFDAIRKVEREKRQAADAADDQRRRDAL